MVLDGQTVPLGSQAYREAREAYMEPIVHAGLPQGGPISPFLSMFALTDCQKELQAKFPNVKWVCYVDDVLFYSDHDQEFTRFLGHFPRFIQQKYQFNLAVNKSQVTKVGDKWLKESIKYLGNRYNVQTGQLISETRSGRSMKYNFNWLIQISQYIQRWDFNVKNHKLYGLVAKHLGSSGGEMLLHLIALDHIVKNWPAEKVHLYFLRGIFRMDPGIKALLRRFLSMSEEAIQLGVRWSGGMDPTEFERLFMEVYPTLSPMVKAVLAGAARKSSIPKGPFRGPFGGLVLSRLFQGTLDIKMNTASGSQDFTLRMKPGSLAQVLQSKTKGGLSLFNGSSYATHEMLNLLKGITLGRKQKLLQRGAMPVTTTQWSLAQSLLNDQRPSVANKDVLTHSH